MFGTLLKLIGQNNESIIILSVISNKGIIGFVRTFED